MKIKETWVARVKKVVMRDVASKLRLAIRKTINQPDNVRVAAMNPTMIWMKAKVTAADKRAAKDVKRLLLLFCSAR